MEPPTIQWINELKSSFLNQIYEADGHLVYEEVAGSLLSEIKTLFGLEEVTLYKWNDWKQQLFVEVSTNPGYQSSIEDSYILCIDFESLLDKRVFYRDFPMKELKKYSLILPMMDDRRTLGLLAITEKNGTNLLRLGSEDWEEFARECYKLIQAASSVSKIVAEEKRYKQLFRVTEKFHSSMSMDAVLGEIISALQEVYPSFTYYLLLSHDNNHENLPIKDLEYDSDNVAAMQAYVSGTIQFEDSISERRSVLYAPLKGKQGVYGVLQVIAQDTLVFPKNEVEFINLLANTAGSALENAQLYQQSKRLISDLQLINETSHRLNSNLRLSETMNYMEEQIRKSFKAEEIGFVMITTAETETAVLGSTDFFQTAAARKYITYVGKKISKEKDSLFIGDLSLQCPEKEIKYRSIMAVPMVQSEDLRGFALVMHQEPYYFSFEMFKLLQSLIYHSTLALANAILREELEKMVITDHLTGLYSRSYLDERMQESMKLDEEGTFILIDIDNFKIVNDTYGHQTGDDILIQVANLIKTNIRDSDVGARWGGEELAIYLPRVSLEIGVTIAERLLLKVEQLSTPKVTISCGVSYWKQSRIDSAKELFRRADEALYRAKNSGKNKVLVH
ncbi:diguanylate cyclase [Peribacillus saganii]|uniref:Diguanylate cyclase n=1 Tax=Peribacillus saganii TaxID=2303992 RepID=A0A372LIL8_9BACI|nr:diguanylate cyclase [Peribacillus saganii]RFU66158.1 diguanylate cyclase [Peribacillus saganii]